MRVLIQRVISASVAVEGETVGAITRGLVLLVGIAATDTRAELDWMAKKCLNLRLFPSPESNRFDRSILEISGELLVVSQFTLYGDGRKGRRPSFSQAAPPAIAAPLFSQFVSILSQSNLKVETGVFGADMQVSLVNDGPVTLWLSKDAD